MSGPKTKQSLKAFMLNVALWMPLGFFLWFYLAAILLWPVEVGVSGILLGLFPDAFHEVTREALVIFPGAILDLPEGRAVASIPIYPMIYGYGLPLIGGLIVSTPISARRRLLQLGLAFVAVALVQIWGCVWEAFRTLAFDFSEPGREALDRTGIAPTLVAFCYQLGYLILPAVTPVILWIAMNRSFIEALIHRVEEPPVPKDGQ